MEFVNRTIGWLRNNFIAAVFVASCVIAVITVTATANNNAQDTRDASIVQCIKGSERAALLSAFQIDAAKARRESGDQKVAERYEAIATGTTRLIPAPPGFENNPALYALKETTIDGKTALVLTDRARTLQKRGCELAFKG